MISFESNSEIEAKAQAAAEAQQAEVDQKAKSVELSLVSLCWTEFDAARRAKEPVQSEMLDLLRARRSQYPATELALIEQEGGGSRIFIPLTQEKIATAVAWLGDLFLTDRPYSCDPTPLPELPEEVKAIIKTECEQQAMMMMPAFTDPGAQRHLIEQMNDQMLSEAREFAKRRAKVNEDRIEDELLQGGFYVALADALDDLCALRAGFLKGPTVRMVYTLQWSKDMTTAEMVRKPVRTFSAPSPFDIYPSPGIANLQQGALSERIRLTLQELVSLKGVDGFRDDMIDEAITRYGTNGTQNWWWEDSERTDLENRGGADMLFTAKGLFDVIEHNTFATGKMMREWGTPVEEVPNDAEVYAVITWMLGRDMLIGARLNPDPQRRRPIDMAGFRRMRGAFWADSVGDIIAPLQKMANAAARSMANNMAMSSGYITEMQIDRLPENQKVVTPGPYDVIQTVSAKPGTGANGQAVFFHQPQINAAAYEAVYQFASRLADTVLGLPSFLSGTTSGGGAGDTSSGLAQLREMATRTFKFTVRGVDQMVVGRVDDLHTDLVLLERAENPLLTGDVMINGKGSQAFGDRQAQQVRLNELLVGLNNPTDLAIMKPEGRAELVRTALAAFDGIDLDRTIPSREKIIFEAKQAMAASMGMDLNGNLLPGAAPGGAAKPGGPPRMGRSTNPDGSVQGDRGRMA